MSKLTAAALRRFLEARPAETFTGMPDACPVAAFLRIEQGAPNPYVDGEWSAPDLPYTHVAHLTYTGRKSPLPAWAARFCTLVNDATYHHDLTGAACLPLLAQATATGETDEPATV